MKNLYKFLFILLLLFKSDLVFGDPWNTDILENELYCKRFSKLTSCTYICKIDGLCFISSYKTGLIEIDCKKLKNIFK